MPTHPFNQLVLALYRAGQEVPFHGLQEHLLGLIKTLVPFDSAWWGHATQTPLEILQMHLHNCDPSILQDYPPYMEQDFFRQQLIDHPGVTFNMSDLTSREAFVRTELYQQVGRRHRIEWSLGTLLIEPVSSLFEFITLWRHDPGQPFNEEERRIKEWLMPHLAQAHHQARLQQVLGSGAARGSAWALADDQARLRDVSPAFIEHVQRAWPRWRGSLLPQPLASAVVQAQRFRAKDLVVDVVSKATWRFLVAHRAHPSQSLAQREAEVARRYASGYTHTEIASAMGLAPATVRNHIANCYKKLNVKSKAELIHRLERGIHDDRR